MPKIICNICLNLLNVQLDKIHSTDCGHLYHFECLNSSLKVNRQCPSCRKQNIKHFALYFETEEEHEDTACAMPSSVATNGFSNSQFNIIMRKLSSIEALSSNNNARCDDTDFVSKIDRLQRENNDLKEIHEMETIIQMTIEKEKESKEKELKEEINQRNDIINSMQLQIDNLRDELKFLKNNVQTANLLDL